MPGPEIVRAKTLDPRSKRAAMGVDGRMVIDGMMMLDRKDMISGEVAG